MKYLISILALFLGFSLSAQNFTVKGTVTDSNDGASLPGAHIQLIEKATSHERDEISALDGKFVFSQVKSGEYTLKVTFLGYQEYTQDIDLKGRSIDLGNLKMQEDAVQLETVQITGQSLPALQKGDTTEISANSYKTLPDASAEDLITKMPTVTMQDGKVQAQGEEVKQVLVDGKPFFGNDPTAALRSLPAEVVDKIQVFDQQSEQAQFTGFQDGETTKTINIVTKSTMKAGQFGKVYGGYGYQETGASALYQAGGQINFFKKDMRLSVIGMSNNINQQNFATEDLLGVMGGGGGGHGPGGGGRGPGGWGGGLRNFLVAQTGGITQTHALGLNYSDEWGEKVEVTASYFFNQAENTLEKFIDREYANSGEFQALYFEETKNSSINSNHRFNARLEFEIDSFNSILFRPRATWQSNDGVSDLFGNNLQGTTLLSETNTLYEANMNALNANAMLLWRHKFAKDRRTLSIDVSGGYDPKRGESSLFSENIFYDGSPDSDTLDQISNLDELNWDMEVEADYTEPVGKNGMLMLNYEFSWQQDDNDRETYDFLESTQSYNLLNEQLSNVFSNDYLTHEAGIGYNFRKEPWSFMIRANYQRASLFNEQTFPEGASFDRTFNNFLPMAMFRFEKSRTNNFHVFYRSNTRLPSIEQMQNVLNNSNPLQLSVGNPELLQSVEHRLFARYTKTSTEKSTVLFVLLGGSLTDNYIANSTYREGDFPIFDQYNVSKGAQITRPVNQDGYRQVRSMVNYGFPFKPLRLNMNVDVSANYTRTPGLVDEMLNFANTTNGGLGLSIASNISDKLDFRISSRTGYNWVTNTLNTTNNSNYLSQSANLRFNWIFWKGFVFRSDVSYQYYDGLSEDFDPNYWLWNMSLGKKLFKNDRGEISIGVFDLLKQNTSLNRTITETYFEDVQSNVLQRFFMLNFTYQIRNFGQAPEQPKEMGPMGPPMGPPPGGPGHFH